MLSQTFQSIAQATRTVFRSWKPLLLTAVVYAALLAAIYSFLAVREASVVQVVTTFALAIVAPLLFFLLQAMITGGIEPDQSVGSFLGRSFVNLWKLLLITLPLIALAVLILYLLNKAQTRLGSSLGEVATDVPRRLGTAASAKPPRPVDCRERVCC